jgi:hypothetical protein
MGYLEKAFFLSKQLFFYRFSLSKIHFPFSFSAFNFSFSIIQFPFFVYFAFIIFLFTFLHPNAPKSFLETYGRNPTYPKVATPFL